MLIKNTGLILEGGGMRGAYTSGVLDAFMDEHVKFPYVIGVSAGASNGADFVAEQRDRNKRVFVDWVKDKRYSGIGNLFKCGCYFNMSFLYEDLPNKLEVFDYDVFKNSNTIFKACATDSKTGKPTYFSKAGYDAKFFMEKILRASSSLPVISKPVEIAGRKYFDGGISDSIPIQKSLDDNNMFNVIILTRNEGYRKEPAKLGFLGNIFLLKYPNIMEVVKNRYKVYNASLDKIEELKKKGEAYVFRPIEPINVDRLERDISKLNKLYEQGYNETKLQMKKFKLWVDNIQKKLTSNI